MYISILTSWYRFAMWYSKPALGWSLIRSEDCILNSQCSHLSLGTSALLNHVVKYQCSATATFVTHAQKGVFSQLVSVKPHGFPDFFRWWKRGACEASGGAVETTPVARRGNHGFSRSFCARLQGILWKLKSLLWKMAIFTSFCVFSVCDHLDMDFYVKLPEGIPQLVDDSLVVIFVGDDRNPWTR